MKTELELYIKANYAKLEGDMLRAVEDAFELAWQAAKAVPEGFVLFPKKQTSKMRSLARDFDARLSLTKYEQLHNIWVKQAMIEVQELAND